MNAMLRTLMFCLPLTFSGGSDVIDSHETIEAEVSRDTILPCRLQSPLDTKTLLVEWKHNGANVHRFRSLSDDPVQDENFKDRTSLFQSEMPEGNVSLKLTNLTKRDAGNYTCNVRIQVLIRKCFVTLNVVDKQEVIQDPRPTTTQPVSQDLSIEAKITISVVVVVVVILGALAIAFGVWKTCEKTSPSGGRNKKRRNKQKNKKKDNTETVSLNNVGNTSNTRS